MAVFSNAQLCIHALELAVLSFKFLYALSSLAETPEYLLFHW
jgi:hypothetical protein